MADLSVNIAGVEWKNPVTTGSGTFGFGREYAEYFGFTKQEVKELLEAYGFVYDDAVRQM